MVESAFKASLSDLFRHLYNDGMHVLLSGASGFLGSACIELLKRFPEIELSVVRASRVECILPLGSRELLLNDVSDSNALLKLVGTRPPSHIIHVAGLSSAATCEREPELAWRANVQFTESLARLACEHGSHMVCASTDLVFDGSLPRAGGFTEDDVPLPVSTYSRSKREAELVTLNLSRGCVVRLALLYGHSHSASRGVLGWMEDALHSRDELVLYSDEFRTPVHVADAARVLLSVSKFGETGIWNCGGPERMSRLQFGYSVAETLGYDSDVIRPALRSDFPATPQRPADVSLNSTKLWQVLGEEPRTIQQALQSE